MCVCFCMCVSMITANYIYFKHFLSRVLLIMHDHFLISCTKVIYYMEELVCG